MDKNETTAHGANRPNILILCMDKWDTHMWLPDDVRLAAAVGEPQYSECRYAAAFRCSNLFGSNIYDGPFSAFLTSTSCTCSSAARFTRWSESSTPL